MFWKWLQWQIEESCDRGFWNAETDYYLNVYSGYSKPWQELWKNKFPMKGK